MIFAITGHTSNIGKSIFDFLNPNIKGFSRSNGYDISSFEDRKRIVEESINCDVFINNAHSDYHQCRILIELFHQWKDQDKIIVNIGSSIADKKTTVIWKGNFDLKCLNYFKFTTWRMAEVTINGSFLTIAEQGSEIVFKIPIESVRSVRVDNHVSSRKHVREVILKFAVLFKPNINP
jgi:hypothetical protein